MAEYDIGDLIRVTGTFKNDAGAATDPTTVKFVFEKPNETATTYVYLTDAQLVRDSPGVFHVDLVPAAGEDGLWLYRWEGTGAVQQAEPGSFEVRPSNIGSTVAAPTYVTAAELRLEVGDEIDTDRAQRLILDAEDLIDELLGVRPVNETTGRKVVAADVDGWRFTKLKRATLKLAVRLYREPGLTGRLWRSVSGPDFSFSGPLSGTEFGSDVEAVLNQSGLRRTTTIVGPGRDRPPWRSFAYNTDYD